MSVGTLFCLLSSQPVASFCAIRLCFKRNAGRQQRPSLTDEAPTWLNVTKHGQR